MYRLPENEVTTIWLDNLRPSPTGDIPESLLESLFGGPKRTYAVFDTAVVSEGIALFETEPGYIGSLLEGDAARELSDVMPCLVELSPDARLTKRLFRCAPGYDAALGSIHLWSANPAIFIRSSSAPEVISKHLRIFLKPMDFLGRRKYLRLWNPSITFDYLHDCREVTPFLRLYLNDPNDSITVIARKNDRAVIARSISRPKPDDRPILTKTDIDALTYRSRSDFHQALVNRVISRGDMRGYTFQRERVIHITKQVMASMQFYDPGDVPIMKDHERLTLVLLMMHDDATPLILSGPIIRNTLLPWSQRVDIVAKSYLTGLRRMHVFGVV